jgi:hypothetical protein
MKDRIIGVIILVILLVSCIKEIPLSEANIDAIVINSIISPDSVVKVNLTKVRGFSESTPVVSDATVNLFENDSLIRTLNYSSNGWYVSNFFPDEGQKYSVEIISNQKELSAETSIPQKTQILNASYSLYDHINDVGENYKTSKSKVTFYDNPNQENYYEIFLARLENGILYYYLYPKYNDISIGTLINDPVLLNEGNQDYEPTSYFFSDELFNGDTITITFPGGGDAYYIDDIFMPDSRNTFVILRSISKEYYNFRKFWTRHSYNQQNGKPVSDPMMLLFVGEPVEMYSNVNNGYGVFTGYSQTTTILSYISNN